MHAEDKWGFDTDEPLPEYRAPTGPVPDTDFRLGEPGRYARLQDNAARFGDHLWGSGR
jgi:hypothetical protein